MAASKISKMAAVRYRSAEIMSVNGDIENAAAMAQSSTMCGAARMSALRHQRAAGENRRGGGSAKMAAKAMAAWRRRAAAWYGWAKMAKRHGVSDESDGGINGESKWQANGMA
jgi:hypothetical protein